MGLTISKIMDVDVKDVVTLWEHCGLTRPWNDPIADISRARQNANSTVLVGRESGKIVASAMVGHDGHRDGCIMWPSNHRDRTPASVGRLWRPQNHGLNKGAFRNCNS